jgi:hypothetical protein
VRIAGARCNEHDGSPQRRRRGQTGLASHRRLASEPSKRSAGGYLRNRLLQTSSTHRFRRSRRTGRFGLAWKYAARLRDIPLDSSSRVARTTRIAANEAPINPEARYEFSVYRNRKNRARREYRLLSADFHHYGNIRPAMYPAWRRCSALNYSRYSPVSRPRCVAVSMKGSTN